MLRFRVHSVNRLAVQQAFTLVELVVGVMLSLMIVGLTVTYASTAKRSFSVQDNELRLQETARFAFQILARQIRLAGNQRSIEAINQTPFWWPTDCQASCGAGELLASALAVRYWSNSQSTACNGQSFSDAGVSESLMANLWWVEDKDHDGVSSLYCQTWAVSPSAPVGRATPLIEGVDDFDWQYGVDQDRDGAVDAYLSSQQLSDDQRLAIKAVRIALLVNAGHSEAEERNTEPLGVRQYPLLSRSSKRFEDRVARSVVSTTVAIPSQAYAQYASD